MAPDWKYKGAARIFVHFLEIENIEISVGYGKKLTDHNITVIEDKVEDLRSFYSTTSDNGSLLIMAVPTKKNTKLKFEFFATGIEQSEVE